MAGFRVQTPAGDGWEYSLDAQNWQTDPLFSEQSPGVALVIGMIYLVYCRNVPQNQFAMAIQQLGTSGNADALTMQALAQRGISGQAAQLLYSAIAGLLPVAQPVIIPTLDQVAQTGHVTAVAPDLGGLTIPTQVPEYEGDFAFMLKIENGRLRALPMDFFRFSEYVVDRMPDAWQGILVEKLYPRIKQRLISEGCLTCVPGSGPTLSSIIILGNTNGNEGGTLQLSGEARYSDGSTAVITDGIWTVAMGTGLSVAGGLVTIPANNVTGDSRPATIRLNWMGLTYSKGIFINDTTQVTEESDVADGHFAEVLPATPFLYPGGFDRNDCDKISGWGRSKANPDTPAVTVIKRDGVEIARRTSSGYRPDVKTYLNNHGIAVNYENFGFEYIKTADDRDGNLHTYWVGSEDGTEYEVNVQKSITCAAPSSGPYPTGGYAIRPQAGGTDYTVPEGGGTRLFVLKQAMSDGTERNYPGNDVSWGVSLLVPGMIYSSNSTSALVSVALSDGAINQDAYIGLNADIPGVSVQHTIQLVNTGCSRQGSFITGTLVYNYAATNQNARLFTTLDDANNTMGAHFAGAMSGQYNAPFAVQYTDLNVGTMVYLGTGSDCATASDNLYYVLDSAGGNTVKVAIQVLNGKIAAVKTSAYGSRPVGAESCTNYGKLSEADFSALPIITVFEYLRETAGPFGSQGRAFSSEAEATAQIRLLGQSGTRAHFDRVRVASTDVKVNDILYGNNAPPDADFSYWPAEGGYWGYDVHYDPNPQFTQPVSYTLLRTNACGLIIERRNVTIPTT